MVGPPNQVMPPEPEVPLPPELVPGVPCQQKPSDTLTSLMPSQGHTTRAVYCIAASNAGVHDPERVLPRASRMQGFWGLGFGAHQAAGDLVLVARLLAGDLRGTRGLGFRASANQR